MLTMLMQMMMAMILIIMIIIDNNNKQYWKRTKGEGFAEWPYPRERSYSWFIYMYTKYRGISSKVAFILLYF